ncbi:MAG: hypothetical protein IPM91_08365 [Bacteroidetes bacterium]|nr:hypothetical protein [Bacteroidota bacterium]
MVETQFKWMQMMIQSRLGKYYIIMRWFLQNPAATIFCVPFGTLSNFADWRTGWPILERDLPFDWFYDKNSFKKIPTSYLGNTYDFYRNNLELLGAQAMITWNMLSSKFYYELASIYRLQELNVPIRYLELGNEFYLNDEYNKKFFLLQIVM